MQSTLRSLSACLYCGLALACSGNGSGTVVTDAVTLVAVDPKDFPSTADPTGAGTSVPACGNPMGSGAYVAELVDVSHVVDLETLEPMPDFPVQVSPASPCNRAVGFGLVVDKRQYIARVSTYADSDGDPNTIDVCTLEGTSLTVTRENGACTAVPAKAFSRFTCYGWQKGSGPATGVPMGTAGATLDGTTAQSVSAGGSTSQEESACVGSGCPGVALQYETKVLHYCVADVER